MTTWGIAHPPIVSQAGWLAARQDVLAREKEITRARDALSAALLRGQPCQSFHRSRSVTDRQAGTFGP